MSNLGKYFGWKILSFIILAIYAIALVLNLFEAIHNITRYATFVVFVMYCVTNGLSKRDVVGGFIESGGSHGWYLITLIVCILTSIMHIISLIMNLIDVLQPDARIYMIVSFMFTFILRAILYWIDSKKFED